MKLNSCVPDPYCGLCDPKLPLRRLNQFVFRLDLRRNEADLEQISFHLSRISLNPLSAKLEAEQI
jgi:hypothetical protein